ncbi:MAG: GH25 family lysozyme [Lachnospira sp.]|nr:GH25 family lysozyme [Lachnospira sp.]
MNIFDKNKKEINDDKDTIEELEIMEIEEVDENSEDSKDELVEEDKLEVKPSRWKRFITKRNGIIAGVAAAVLVCTVIIVVVCTKKNSVVVATNQTTETTETNKATQEASTEEKKDPLLQMKLEAIADETSITANVLAEDGSQIEGQEFVINLLEGSVEDNKDVVDYIKSEKDKVNQEKTDETKTTETATTTQITSTENSSDIPEKLVGAQEYKDDDMDGTIYIGNLSTGTYTVAVRAKEGYDVPDAVETSIVKYEVIEDILEQVVQQDEETRKEDPSQNREPTAGGETSTIGGTTVGNKTTITVTYPKVDPNNNSSLEYCRYIYTATKAPCVLSNDEIQKYEKADAVSIQQDSGTMIVSGYILEKGSATAEKGTVDVITKLIVEKKATVSENITNNLGTPAGTNGTAETEGTTGETDSTTQGTTEAPKQYEIYNLNPVMESKEIEVFDGWVQVGGEEYYYVEGNRYTGWHLIDGLNYYFNEDGVLSSDLVIDISQFNGPIDWNAVKASGIDRAIIRVGYRGYGSAKLVYDSRFYENMSGATAAGIEVGAYVVTQATNTSEAVAEASFIIEACSGYNITLPLAIDVEWAGAVDEYGNVIEEGRGNFISVAERTEVINAFAATVSGAGYTPMVYANMNWMNNYINASALRGDCQVWVAQYNGDDSTWYQGRYNMWQFTSSGGVNGIGGSVDVSAWKN